MYVILAVPVVPTPFSNMNFISTVKMIKYFVSLVDTIEL